MKLPNNYKNLIVWQKAIEYVVELYKVLSTFPAEEKYCLCDQMRRSAVSIPSNIAEGYCREYEKDTLRFLSISRGSIGELETQIILSERLGYINFELSSDLQYKLNGINVMLISLMSKLRNSSDQSQS